MSIKKYKEYKSPLRKLVRFFEQSRDNWKQKSQERKRKNKYLKKRIVELEKSKEKWKGQAKEGEMALKKLKREKEEVEKELGDLQEKTKKEGKGLERGESFEMKIVGHRYTVGYVQLFITMVLFASASLRSASNSIKIMQSLLGGALSSPSWSTGRLWLLRLGY